MPSGSRFPPQPGRPRRDPVRVVQRVGEPGAVARREPGSSEARPTGAGVGAVETSRSCDLSGGDPEEDHVVDDLRLTGLDARGRHERVSSLLRVEEEAAVVVRDALRRRGAVRGLHAEVQQRLAERTSGPRGCSRLARRAVDPSRLRAPTRGSSRAAARSGFSCPDRRTPASASPAATAASARPGRQRRSRSRSDEICFACLQRERRDSADSMTAGALLGDDRRDVLREARRCGRRTRTRLAAHHREGRDAGLRARRRRRAATTIRVPLRMLGVICTPKLAEDATDLADRAAGAERFAHRPAGDWRRSPRRDRTSSSAALQRRGRASRAHARVRSR